MAILTPVADLWASLGWIYTPLGPEGRIVSEAVMVSGCVWSLLVSEAVVLYFSKKELCAGFSCSRNLHCTPLIRVTLW